jgi:lipid II:glycine glycyltransferase (peptidoglycan interpeptide bridge formation enzyme)
MPRARLAGKWRNALAQAERRPLEIRAGSAEEIRWLLDRNEAHRREVGYRGPSRAFLGRLARHATENGELLALLAREGGTPLAGILIVRHGASATYEVGYVSPRGRELRAKHLLLWRALGLLRDQGVRWLDLGGVATDRAPGIARFKLGLGGDVATLAGTFLV